MRSSAKFSAVALAVCFAVAVSLLLANIALATNRGIAVTTKSGKPVKLYRDYAALVIGVNDYQYWPKLPGAIRDAKDVAAALTTMGFKVKLVQNPDSDTLAGLLKRLPYNQGKPKDRALLIYFAGHGATESLADGTKMGYIVPKDCPLPTVDPAGFAELAISMRRFEDLALRVKCRHVLMAFDSCFSGSLFALGRAAPRDISEKIARPVRQFVTAGNENEEVPDQSTFKQVFIDGIGGEADYDRDGYVTGSELGMYLQKQVVNYTRGAQHPQYGKIRNPKLDKGDFVFLLAGGPGTTPAVKPTPPPPAPPKAPSTDELAALEEKAKRKAAWDAWQKRMDAYWAKLEKLDASSLAAKEKAQAWRGALAKFRGNDNPFSDEDEKLLLHAQVRANYWEQQARAAKQAKPKPMIRKQENPKRAATVVERSSDGRYTKDPDGVITDSRTGLQWYVEPNRNSNCYDDAKKWVESLTVAGGGWRMPSRNELESLYQKGKGSHNTDPIFKISDWGAWAGETSGAIGAGMFNFYIGKEAWCNRYNEDGFYLKALAVRSVSKKTATSIPMPPKRFTKDAEGLITDHKTGLQWCVGPDEETTWYDAENWVEKLNDYGFDWRLPSLEELRTLYQDNDRIPKLDPIFKATGRWVWSDKTESSVAWFFNFSDGRNSNWGISNSENRLRGFAVRSAPSNP